MTQKELLYLEDAIGHEQNLEKICQETIKQLQNDQLISFMNEEANKHQSLKEQLINVMEGQANV